MSGWTYRHAGMVSDETVGPISGEALLQLAYDGKIKLETPISHPEKTKGQWVPLSRIPAAVKKVEQGAVDRAQAKADAAQEKQQKRDDARAAASARRDESVAQKEAAHSTIAKFLTDGQPESVTRKIVDRVKEILTSQEELQYIAIQAKPVAIAPDAIVLTDRRVIIYSQSVLGKMSFRDFLWRDLRDARVKEGMMFGEISVQSIRGEVVTIDYLPKPQARRIYRIAQEREEAAIEERRQREMEESRAGASNVVVHTPTQQAVPSPTPAAEDPVEKLTKLKKMLDAGLIEQSEYDAAKAKVLAAM